MFARVSKYRMKKESVEAARALLDQLKPQIMALPGMKSFTNVMNDDGNGYVVAVVESEEISIANQDKVAALWAKFADHLAEPPTTEGFKVLMSETNG